jgi:predicted methyltransferase
MKLHTLRTALLVAATAVAGVAAQDGSHDRNRDAWQRVDEIFAAMGIKPGAAVADIGAGGGFFTTRLSRAVGDSGRVFAVDISADVVRRLRERAASDGLKNVEVIQGAASDPKLPAASLDAALIVNAYHEMNDHQAMLAAIKAALKPGGRLVIVEPISASRRPRPRDEQTRNHEIGVAFVMEDAREAGFTHLQVQDPFTKRPHGNGDEEWLLVLSPAAPPPPQTSPPTSSSSGEWKSPDLRISPEAFKRLAGDEVLVLDVRDPDSYRSGHLPGAVLMTLEDLSKPETIAKLTQEKRRIITYCS